MSTPQLFLANIQISTDKRDAILRDRIASKRIVNGLSLKPQALRTISRMHNYRNRFRNLFNSACIQSANFTQLETTAIVQRFIALANTLEESKAIALCIDTEEGVHTEHGSNSEASRDNLSTGKVDSEGTDADVSIDPLGCDSLDSKYVNDALLHPLSIAFIAYQLGGPVNAAFGTHMHEWRSPGVSTDSIPAFYSEGDTGNVFSEFRMTVVWEIRNGQKAGLSGTHHVFLSEDSTPRKLTTLGPTGQGNGVRPTTIIYDSNHAALYYDCQNPEVIRKSASLNFYRNTIDNDDLRLMSKSTSGVLLSTSMSDVDETLTLSQLVTGFAIPNYAVHFNRLIFSAESLKAMVIQLSSLDVPKSRLHLGSDAKKRQIERYEAFKKDARKHIPPAIQDLKRDVPISGEFDSAANFMAAVVMKARRDVHVRYGADLVPDGPLDENWERARRFIRDMPETRVAIRLEKYNLILTRMPYTEDDLLSTTRLYELAKKVEEEGLRLVSDGYVDSDLYLHSMGSLSITFADAINGSKEIQWVPEPWVTAADTGAYRARCLYLFWCADWLACYMLELVEGPVMISNRVGSVNSFNEVQEQIEQIARLFLRNWVAWGMFTEGLPPTGLLVPRSANLGMADQFRDPSTSQEAP